MSCGKDTCKTNYVIDMCGLCKQQCFNICPFCILGTKSSFVKYKTVYTKCPNKHVYHAGCLAVYAMEESTCPICQNELVDCMTCDCEGSGLNGNLCPICTSYLDCDCGTERIIVK